MRVLLDPHALLWWFTDDPRLSLVAREAIGNMENSVLVSAASAWEIATRHRLGKLNEAEEVVARFSELVAADGFEHLPIAHYHALATGVFAVPHRDPFDRMLAAQSAIEGVPLVSIDPVFRQFGTQVLW